MGIAHVLLNFLRIQERIIDVRQQVVPVVQVDDPGTGGDGIRYGRWDFGRIADVVIPLRPVRVGVHRLDRRDQQGKPHQQRLPRRQAPRAGEGVQQHPVALLSDVAAALAFVGPLLRQPILVAKVQGRPDVLHVLELALQPRVRLPHPHHVVGEIDAPAVLPLLRPVAALATEAQEVPGDVPAIANLQARVGKVHVLCGLEREVVIHMTVELNVGAAIHGQRPRNTPGAHLHTTGGKFFDGQPVVLPFQRRPSHRRNKLDRSMQDVCGRFTDTVTRRLEKALDLPRQAVGTDEDSSPQARDSAAVHLQWRIERRGLVVDADSGIEPADSRVPPQLTVAAVFQHGPGHRQRDLHRQLLPRRGNDGHAAAIRPCRVAGHVHAQPERLYLARGNGNRLREMPADPVVALQVEARDRLRRNDGPAFVPELARRTFASSTSSIAYTATWKA